MAMYALCMGGEQSGFYRDSGISMSFPSRFSRVLEQTLVVDLLCHILSFPDDTLDTNTVIGTEDSMVDPAYGPSNGHGASAQSDQLLIPSHSIPQFIKSRSVHNHNYSSDRFST